MRLIKRLALLVLLPPSLFGTMFAQTFASNPSAVSHSTITVYSDVDLDGTFEPTAAYRVSPEEALAAYASEHDLRGSGDVLFQVSEPESGQRIGSGEGFLRFLSAHYEPIDHITLTAGACGNNSLTGGACDNGVTVAFALSCSFNCPQPCPSSVTWTATVTCHNNPQCPASRTCVAYPNRINSITTNQQACACNGMSVCTLQAGTVVTGFTTAGGPVCECTVVNATPMCPGDGTAGPCPCGNNGAPGHGCENSSTTGGALLSASGSSSLSADTLVLTSSGERPTALTILLQGSSQVGPAFFGDGLRCAGGVLKRPYSKNAVGGVVSFPGSGDPKISARSAALGDPIPVGGIRFYLAYYRDPDPVFCPSPAGGTFNSSSGMRVVWSM